MRTTSVPRLQPETPKGGIAGKADLRTRFDELVAAMDTELRMVRLRSHRLG